MRTMPISLNDRIDTEDTDLIEHLQEEPAHRPRWALLVGNLALYEREVSRAEMVRAARPGCIAPSASVAAFSAGGIGHGGLLDYVIDPRSTPEFWEDHPDAWSEQGLQDDEESVLAHRKLTRGMFRHAPPSYLAAFNEVETFLITNEDAPGLALTLAEADRRGIGRLFPLELWLAHWRRA